MSGSAIWKRLASTKSEVKAIAANFEIEDGPNAEGSMFFREAIPADAFPSPFENDEAARAANGGALPPDLSLQAKRNAIGPDFIVWRCLTGYESDRADRSAGSITTPMPAAV